MPEFRRGGSQTAFLYVPSRAVHEPSLRKSKYVFVCRGYNGLKGTSKIGRYLKSCHFEAPREIFLAETYTPFSNTERFLPQPALSGVEWGRNDNDANCEYRNQFCEVSLITSSIVFRAPATR